MQIHLKVSHHPSGRYTLMTRRQNEKMFADAKEPALLGNDNKGDFYQAVASLLSQLHVEGHEVSYEDFRS